MLKEGIYQLSAPLCNPRPDRRRRDDWTSLPEFPAGRYIVSHNTNYPLDGDTLVRITNVGSLNSLQGIHRAKDSKPEDFDHGYMLLASRLTPVPEDQWTLRDRIVSAMRDHKLRPQDLLVYLYNQGIITPDHIRRAAEALAKMDEADLENQMGMAGF